LELVDFGGVEYIQELRMRLFMFVIGLNLLLMVFIDLLLFVNSNNLLVVI